MQCPEEVQLRREDGEALRQRLADAALTADDRRVLDQVLQWYFWLVFALQEATFSLKRLRVMLFVGIHLRRDTVISQWFQGSKAAAASNGHTMHF